MSKQLKRLKELRQEKGISLSKLSKILKEKYDISVSTSQLMYYEKGEREPRNKQVWEMLADYFGVSEMYLLGYSDFKNEDAYYEAKEKERVLDIDILNSIATIGEKNLPLVYDFFEKEFEKEYAPAFKYEEEVDGWTFDESVKAAMGNVTDNLWGLPDSVVKLVTYWSTLKDNERESLLEVIKTLSLNNLDKDLLPPDND